MQRARFGPYAIRSGSRRQRDARGYTLSWAHDPFAEGKKIVDCGDVSLVDLLLTETDAFNDVFSVVVLFDFIGTYKPFRQRARLGSNGGGLFYAPREDASV